MFYIMYLTGLCSRRHWPQPAFSSRRSRSGGWLCTVRVNNREYTTDRPYETEQLARDAAATRAYMICRNFSANDGMYPGEKPGVGEMGRQGLPAAIGSGRGSRSEASDLRRGSIATNTTRSHRSNSDDTDAWSAGSHSGGDSPRSLDSGRSVRTMESAASVSKSRSVRPCYCQRGGPIREYGRCGYCVREAGWG